MNHTHSERLEPGAWKIIAVVILGPFMSQMDSTIVNVSLSFIKQELHASIASAQWVVSGYLLALALLHQSAGWHFGGSSGCLDTPARQARIPKSLL